MERKRKLPARAAARVEQVSKKRNVTPRERSETPAPVEEPGPPPPPPLPKSIQAGKPLPTVEDAQPDDLPAAEFQSISESGVLAESLLRSRHKWVSDGLFEKYWSRPHKRKGVITEDPKNPPKDSMFKLGTVSISIEPHVVEATMYAVKGPKPKPQQTSAPAQQQQTPQVQMSTQTQPSQQHAQTRPIIQYGPPSGSMPPPPAPSSAAATPNSASATPKPAATSQTPNQTQPSPNPQSQPVTSAETPMPAAPSPVAGNATPSLSPSYPPRPAPPPASSPAAAPPAATPPPVASNPSPAPAAGSTPTTNKPVPAGASGATPTPSPGAAKATTSAAGTPGGKPAATDPVIALLAQRASGDPKLRDLMKRVAVGQAKDGELAHFQKIIDNLNAEYKRTGGQQGPSADRLLVDGRTVKYFADEVRTILDIVLASNPNQKSTELRPPPRSDPLVVLLVKTALEDQRTKDMIKRIADGRPGFTDATDLKEILDRLHRDARIVPKTSPTPSQARQSTPNGTPNAQPNGHAKASAPQNTAQNQSTVPNTQALRSKGPPPAPKHDISAVVLDFGSGDRHLFPKFSVLEYLPTSSGQQVVASFLIVRKGSMSEYGGDPELDYYQPVTIRLYTPTGRHLENLARVVAPQDEVRRYMDDVMDNMTRAEYVLLAMRLPRMTQEDEKEDSSEGRRTSASTPKPEVEEVKLPAKPAVLWTSTATKPARPSELANHMKPRDPEQESQHKYQRLVNLVAAKEPEAV